ncbi:MAG: hypothetical protein HYT40_02225 [Candidatus Sungbacteria bacterium]|uniref:Uncharacterized protein n=1 Tax=Candidatus Sungiibacteriota bacterium TaxID=2750080 RepID=A0A931SBN8_9BACT|nr:hypothetical protein [Candidatus Sungbacteria bacterium]
MTFTIAAIGFSGFVLFYALFASAIIYHLRAYVLPGWTAGRISIIIFLILSLILLYLALFYFLKTPWGLYAGCPLFNCVTD